MNKHLGLRQIAVIAGAALLAPACTERVVDMDGPKPVVNVEATEAAADDVVVVLNEPVFELRSDGTRLYWYSETLDSPCISGSPMKALRSCVIEHCADTLVTYADSSVYCNRTSSGTEGYPLTSAFTTDGENVYWGTNCGVFATGFEQMSCGNVLACPVSGCESTPSVVLPGGLTTGYLMAQKLYWLSAYNPIGLQRCDAARCAESIETLVTFDDTLNTGGHGLTLNSTHAYWASGASIRRVALDGQSPVETIASSLSSPRGLSLTESDVYWANRFFPGTVTRCPLEGCGTEDPTEVVAKQTYPNWTGVIGSSLFWTNTAEVGNAAELRRCALADCVGTNESVAPTARRIRGHFVDDDTLYFGTNTDADASTSIHRRKY